MAAYRSGIGQNADAPPCRRQFQYSNRRVMGTASSWRNSVVVTSLYAPEAQAPRPLARCPTVAQFPFHKTPGLFHKTSGLSIRGEAP